MTKIDAARIRRLSPMTDVHSVDGDAAPTKSPFDRTSNNKDEEEIWISWVDPFHLFYPDSGDSLCGQSGDREDMSQEETELFTSSLPYLMGHISSQEELVRFGSGICIKCLRSLCSNSDSSFSYLIEDYSDEILDYEESSPLGFCYSCSETIDTKSCNTAMFKSRQPIYMCDLCCMESFEGIMSNLGEGSDPTIEAIQQRLRKRITEERERRLE